VLNSALPWHHALPRWWCQIPPESAFFTDKLTHIMHLIWIIKCIKSWGLKIKRSQPISLALLIIGLSFQIGSYVWIFNIHRWISKLCQIFANNCLSTSHQKADFGGGWCEFIMTKQVTMAVLCSRGRRWGLTLPSIQKWLSRSLQTCTQWLPRQPLGASIIMKQSTADMSLMALSPKWPSQEGVYNSMSSCTELHPKQPMWLTSHLHTHGALLLLKPLIMSWNEKRPHNGAPKTPSKKSLCLQEREVEIYINKCYFSMVSTLFMRFQRDTLT
jgi:hypothetical protein